LKWIVARKRREVTCARFLKEGAFDAQNPITIPIVKLQRRLGVLRSEDFDLVAAAVKAWLGF
jgi:hypothetical protein